VSAARGYLRAVMMTRPDALDTVLEDVWVRLRHAVRDRRSALHTPVVATRNGDGVRQRVMVLRAVDREAAALRFHTDARSAKLATLSHDAAVSVLGYDADAGLQMSLAGTAMCGDAAITDAAWAATPLYSRRCYLAQPAPGTAVDGPASGLSDDLSTRRPTRAESEAGRTNFATLIVTITQIDWLALDARGNWRAAFTRAGSDWRGTWLIP
jgi:pyridoxamine 5'-phosphate oxidase